MHCVAEERNERNSATMDMDMERVSSVCDAMSGVLRRYRDLFDEHLKPASAVAVGSEGMCFCLFCLC